MSKLNGVLAGLVLAAAATFGGAPQAAAAQAGVTQTVVPAGFDHCWAEYRMCLESGGDRDACFAMYESCEQA